MMIYDMLCLLSTAKVKRFKRIAEAFSTKKDGPFRLSGNSIHIINDDTVKLGSVEIKDFSDGLHYFTIIIDQVCFSYDDIYRSRFYEYLDLLVWLDSLWETTTMIDCPICHKAIVISDEINKLIKHINTDHTGIVVEGLESVGYDVNIKTNIGVFVLENCKVY